MKLTKKADPKQQFFSHCSVMTSILYGPLGAQTQRSSTGGFLLIYKDPRRKATAILFTAYVLIRRRHSSCISHLRTWLVRKA